MTSSVTVHAHLVNTKEVRIKVRSKETGETIKDCVLQDGEKETFNVFDDREVIVSEVDK